MLGIFAVLEIFSGKSRYVSMLAILDPPGLLLFIAESKTPRLRDTVRLDVYTETKSSMITKAIQQSESHDSVLRRLE